MDEVQARLLLLEKKVQAHDALIEKLVAFARTSAKGRLVLALLGVK